MGDSYEKVKDSERVEAIRERARIIVDAEKRFPRAHQYHQFMHFVVAADSTGQSKQIVWEGVTRRVAEVVTSRTDELEHRLDGKLAQIKSEMSSKLELLDGDVAQIKSEMNMLGGELVQANRNLQMILDRLK